MKKNILIIGILILVVMPMILATGFSPTKIVLDLEPSEESCQIVTVNSDSELITVSDKWAANKDVEWKISLFNTDAEPHGLSVTYDTELGINERNVEVCLSGNEVGEYHGVLLLTEGQQGNSIVQMGIWLKVIITKEAMEKIIDESPKEISNPSGSSSSGSYYQATTPITKKNNDSIIKVDNLNSVEVNNGVNKETVEPGSAGITGNVAGSGLTEKNWVIIGGVLIVLVIIIIFVYNKQKNTRVERI